MQSILFRLFRIGLGMGATISGLSTFLSSSRNHATAWRPMDPSSSKKSTYVCQNNERILSIQSHIAFGFVGGKAAVFALQCMGYDVDVVNTVSISTHHGYGRWGGTKTTAEELTDIFNYMDMSGVLSPRRLLTGYVPSATALDAVHQLVRRLKARDANLIYLLDPVLGDLGQLYVTQEVIPVYRKMLPLATVITPNWFEVETLTDIKLSDLSSLRCALRKLHIDYQVPNVVISSVPLSKIAACFPSYLLPDKTYREIVNDSLSDGDELSPLSDPQSYLVCIVSSAPSGTSPSVSSVYARCVVRFPGYFSGVGDLFSALLLGHWHSVGEGAKCSIQQDHPSLVAHATAHALSKTHAILSLTHSTAMADSLPPTDDELDAREPQRRLKRMKGRELKLVQGQDIFRSQQSVKAMKEWERFWEE